MTRQERAIRTRMAILVAAADVFDEVGYEAATISEILQRSGMTKGALYFHFASKEELAQGVLAAQVDAVPPIPKQIYKLQEAVDRALMLSYLLKRDPMLRGSVRLTVDLGSPKDGLDRRVPLQEWTDLSKHLFDEAKAAGELLAHVDTDSTAKLFVGGFTGIQLMSQIMTGREDMEERMSDLYRNLMTPITVPAVLLQLDFSVNRGAKVYEAAMKQREEEEGAVPA
ncbi:ScbR family autoregulator-binding transcription factor [Streptomyces sp. NPDC002926]